MSPYKYRRVLYIEMKFIETEKRCTKCGKELPVSAEYFYRDGVNKDGLRPDCKVCHDSDMKEYLQTERGKKAQQKADKRYYDTINGRLQSVFSDMNQRCNNPKNKRYKHYGGRGIRCLFTLDSFKDYVTDTLGYDTYDEIEGLQIHRIDNDGHYEPGNIEFLAPEQYKEEHRQMKSEKWLLELTVA